MPNFVNVVCERPLRYSGLKFYLDLFCSIELKVFFKRISPPPIAYLLTANPTDF